MTNLKKDFSIVPLFLEFPPISSSTKTTISFTLAVVLSSRDSCQCCNRDVRAELDYFL